MATRSLNKVMLIGNLTRDPELRYTAKNTAVCSFGLATNRSWTPANGGEKEERVEFHNIVAWAKLAEICDQLLHKGDKVYVEGRLQTNTWTGDDEVERRTTEVVIDNMILLRSPSGQSSYGDTDAMPSEAASGSRSSKSRSSKKKKGGGKKLAGQSEGLSDSDASDAEDISDDVPF